MVNEVTLVGNLGAKPELKKIGEDNAVTTLSVATSRRVKRGDAWEDETTWHRVTVWGRQAESCAQYLDKGRQVLVKGRIQNRSYEKDGAKVWVTDIVADDVKFLGGKSDKASGGSSYTPPVDDSDGTIPF